MILAVAHANGWLMTVHAHKTQFAMIVQKRTRWPWPFRWRRHATFPARDLSHALAMMNIYYRDAKADMLRGNTP